MTAESYKPLETTDWSLDNLCTIKRLEIPLSAHTYHVALANTLIFLGSSGLICDFMGLGPFLIFKCAWVFQGNKKQTP